jgi:choice-of-anchor B domain-containing protein
MKQFIFCLALLVTLKISAQVYSSYNVNLISVVTPNNLNPSVNKYSGCWGWYQADKNKEYAISGGSHGTYFIDITNPITPTVSAYVPGSSNCTWRELKTYKNYCYIVSDVCKPNKFQIIDMQYLPDSVHVIHSGTDYFELGHTVWIDTTMARMYVGSTTFTTGHSPLTIYSLATPTAPVLLKRIEEDIPSSIIPEVHDMFARNDTIYVSAAWKGIQVLRYDAVKDSLIQLGSYASYPGAGYNHSSFLTQNGKHLMFCDEVPSSLPIHVVDVQNLGNIQPVVSFRPHPQTTAHNPFIIGNEWAIVSCYKDGLQIYDISDPNKISLAGFFDTYPQEGFNTGDYGGGAYGGNWGAYPYLPSKIIIANDMQNGVFLLDATSAYTTQIVNPIDQVGVKGFAKENTDVLLYPNPANKNISLKYKTTGSSSVQVKNLMGQLVFEKEFYGPVSENMNLETLASGTYIISVSSENWVSNKKLIITR